VGEVPQGLRADGLVAAHLILPAAERGLNPPLDIEDGPARIVDPIIVGINSGDARAGGKLLMGYAPSDW
jgi:hypothetical protein